MELNELLELLEIEEPSEFEYFENMADLLESEEPISSEAIVQLFAETDAEVVSELLASYFDEMLEILPEEATDLYTLLETVKLSLIGLMRTGGEEGNLVQFGEEFLRFRSYYASESEVICKSVDGDSEKSLPLRDALTLVRLEKLESEEYTYNFEDCLKYEIDEYIVSFADVAREDPEEDDEGDLLERGYVYDDEMRD